MGGDSRLKREPEDECLAAASLSGGGETEVLAATLADGDISLLITEQ